MTLGIIDYFKDYVGYNPIDNSYPLEGVIKFGIDALLVLILLIFLIRFLVKHTKSRKILVLTLVYIVVFFIVSTLGLKLFQICLSIGAIIYLGILVVNYAPEVKTHYTGLKRTKGEKGFITSEQTKEVLIDQLIKTVEYLTSRQIGAIITIEKENSLNTYIEKSTKIEALVSFELLATIFFVITFMIFSSILSFAAGYFTYGYTSTNVLSIFNATTPIVMSPLLLMLINILSLLLEAIFYIFIWLSFSTCC